MKKRPVIAVIVAIITVTAICALVFLYERSEAALLTAEDSSPCYNECSSTGSSEASPHGKVLILSDGTVARYVSEDDNSYTGDIQDTFTVSKEEAAVEDWYACDGKGVIFLKEYGKTPVFIKADENSEAIGELCFEEGYVPETLNCTGFGEGWFTVDFNGTNGYVPAQNVIWDTIDTF